MTASQIYLLNERFGRVAHQVQLGTLLAAAEAVLAGEIAMAEGIMHVGSSGGVASALDISAGGNVAVGNDTTVVALDASGNAKMLLGNGTTITSVSMSGDATIDNAGAVSFNYANRVSYFDDFLGVAANLAGTGFWDDAQSTLAAHATIAYGADSVNGEMVLQLESTSEAQIAVLNCGNQHNWDFELNPVLEFSAKVLQNGTGATELLMGFAGDHNDTADSVVTNAWFKIVDTTASLGVVIEGDDGTNDDDDNDTGITLTDATYATFKIDASDPADVQFYIDGASANNGATIDMSNYTGNVSPYFKISKTTGDCAGSLTIDWVRIYSDRA